MYWDANWDAYSNALLHRVRCLGCPEVGWQCRRDRWTIILFFGTPILRTYDVFKDVFSLDHIYMCEIVQSKASHNKTHVEVSKSPKPIVVRWLGPLGRLLSESNLVIMTGEMKKVATIFWSGYYIVLWRVWYIYNPSCSFPISQCCVFAMRDLCWPRRVRTLQRSIALSLIPWYAWWKKHV